MQNAYFVANDNLIVRSLKIFLEVLLFIAVIWAPWPLGSVFPFFEGLLFQVVALSLVIAASLALLSSGFTWKPCPLTWLFATIFLVGSCYLIPLPQSVLSIVSPATAGYYETFLPEVAEQVTEFDSQSESVASNQHTLTLEANATRLWLFRWLALSLLFVVVRQFLASRSTYQRLIVALLINSCCLTVFALVQKYTSTDGQVFWSLQTGGSVFGPFVCRNHFSDYVNLALGLSSGLLLGVLWRKQQQQRTLTTTSEWLSLWLNSPIAVWLSAGIVLCSAGVFLSLSRGGILALILAAILTGLLSRTKKHIASPVAVTAIICSAAFLTLAWIGLDPVEARLTTLFENETVEKSRFPIWSMFIPLIKQFPLFGTGNGTFTFVEFLPRTISSKDNVIYEYAHNMYLEIAIEGGLLQLSLFVLLTGLVLRQGIIAYQKHPGTMYGGMALGGFFAITALVIHCLLDFGFNLPSIAFPAFIIIGQMTALAQDGRQSQNEEAKPVAERNGKSWSHHVIRLILAGFLFVFAIVIYTESNRYSKAEMLRTAARHFQSRFQDTPEKWQPAAKYLEDAVRLRPWDGGLHLALAESNRSLARQLAKENDPEANKYQIKALQHYLLARNLSPTLETPHARLASMIEFMDQHDPAENYLRRATLARPVEPELWYMRGLVEWNNGDKQQSLSSWRNSLKLSPDYFAKIWDTVTGKLSATDVCQYLLPEDITYFKNILQRKEFGSLPEAEKVIYYRSTLNLLEKSSGPVTPDHRYEKGRILAQLGNRNEAIQAYEAALLFSPAQTKWSLELVELYVQAQQLDKAIQTAQFAVRKDPDSEEARRKLAELNAKQNKNQP